MKKRYWTAVVCAVIVASVAGLMASLKPRVSLSGDISEVTTEHGGRQRHYLVYRPAQLAENAPLLLVFHGSGLTGNIVRDMSARQFDRLADREGLLVIYPDGVENHWNDCRAGAAYAANQLNIDDVGFVRQLVGEAKRDFAIDERRVYASGHSNGGHLALRLALEAPDLVAGVAPVAANLPVDDNLDCVRSGKPANVLLFAGTLDSINPYQGGLVEIFGDKSRGVVRSAQDTANYFADLAGYEGKPDHLKLPDTVPDDDGSMVADLWLGRDQRVGLITVEGGGHLVPSTDLQAVFELLPGVVRDHNAADVMWSFFTATGSESGLPHGGKSQR